MTQIFVSAFYLKPIYKNMDVVSEKILYHIYTLKRKRNKESLPQFPRIYSNSLHVVILHLFLLKCNSTQSLFFDIEQTILNKVPRWSAPG
jgi:hypothetical protein